VHFTNASCILREDFRDAEDGATGFFSGWNEEQRAYDKQTWSYTGNRGLSFPERDLTLQHPRCVFQALRRHFARYTPEMVEKICGISPALFYKVAEALAAASGPEKSAAICYALGWTQHSKGVQIIRTAAILQLLLGNIGRPGGGILALRGHASIQGSTDVPTLYDILPGYLPMPRGDGSEETLRDYLAHQTKPTGLWSNTPAYFISLLKAYYGKNATAENDFGYNFVPKITGNHSLFEYMTDMADGKMEGMFIMGQNPAVAAPNSRLQRKALARLKWLVVRDMVDIEAASFWADSPEIERGELKGEEIETEVFFSLAGHAENDGTFTNTQRLCSGARKRSTPGDCRSDEWFMHQLAGTFESESEGIHRSHRRTAACPRWWYAGTRATHGSGPGGDQRGYTLGRGRRPSRVARRSGLRFGSRRPTASRSAGYRLQRIEGRWIDGVRLLDLLGVLNRDGVNKANTRQSKDYLGMGGFSPGRATGVSYIIERAPVRRANRGASVRNLSGGTGPRANGPESMSLISQSESRLNFAPPETKADLTEFRGMRHSCCTRTGSAGFMCRKGCKMGRCRPTTSRSNRRHNAFYSRDTDPAVNWFTREENLFAPPGDPRFCSQLIG
jgi:anaerobic selenocysteine-containing dehydrogenase